jgi:cell division protein FtsB
MKPIIAESPEDKDREIARLRRRNVYLQRQNECLLEEIDVLKGQGREYANRQQRDAQRCAQRNGIGFAGCSND